MTSTQDGAAVDVPALRVRIHIAQAEQRPGGALVVYDLRFNDRDEEGIRVLAVGYGDTPDKAFGEAAFQWTTGVFIAVQHWLQPSHHTCFADDLHLVVRAPETGEELGWRVHFGPVLSRTYGEGDPALPGKDALEVIRALFDRIHPHAAHRMLFWIEAFVVLYADGRVDATCRLSNDDWPEGRQALLEWAATWTLRAGTMVSVRQFFLFEPIGLSQLPDRDKLQETLDRLRPKKKGWWRRMLGG